MVCDVVSRVFVTGHFEILLSVANSTMKQKRQPMREKRDSGTDD
jgi:hypothetical protein